MSQEKPTSANVSQGQPANGDRPLSGAEFLASLRDSREVWIYGERVKDVTEHPAFRNSARSLARMYDALRDPAKSPTITTGTDTGNGGFTHKFFKVPRNMEELIGGRDAIAEWAKISYGWMGRSPDYKASLTGTLGANADFYAPYQENAVKWYRKVQEKCLFLNHAIINPPTDKSKSPDEVTDVFVHAEKETDAGVIVSGAKVVATGSALTHCNFIGSFRWTARGLNSFAAPLMSLRQQQWVVRLTIHFRLASMRTTQFWYSIKYSYRGRIYSFIAIWKKLTVFSQPRDSFHALRFTDALALRLNWIF
jgi:4-hydroxyphenylacetate 3-hydroxylase N terminal